jgi:NAD(P)-dependent dehydrogenase (short-subunit alcohol dehydrogenase family)
LHKRSYWTHIKPEGGSILTLRQTPALDMNNEVVFLASYQSSYVTGKVIKVTGGQEIR